MKPLRILITQDSIQLDYEHSYQEKANGELKTKDARERDQVAADLLRTWVDRLQSGAYEQVGHATDARKRRRDQLSVKEGM